MRHNTTAELQLMFKKNLSSR